MSEPSQYERLSAAREAQGFLAMESTFMGFLRAEFSDTGEGDFRCVVPVRDDLKQPMGIVHGGIYAAISESLASMGSAMAVGYESGLAVMGQANNTSFLRPVTQGSIHAVGTIRHRGRTSMVWQVDMRDDEQRLCATSQVTIAIRPLPERPPA